MVCLSPEDLARHVIDVSLRLKDKLSSVALLQSELSNLRQQSLNQSKSSEQDLKSKLKAQKDEYETAIKRHQKFIDQLIADKKSLNQQCENLVTEMKSLEDRYQSNIKAMEHKHQVEMQKCKEMQLAGEKIRRERWIDSKTQKIKELTVKSIEPEMKSMELRQQQEISDLRMLHRREIEDLELKNARKMQEQLEALRNQLLEEREKIISKEKEIMRQRYENMLENEEKNYQELKKKLNFEQSVKLKELEEKEVTLNCEKQKSIKQAQSEFEDNLQIIVRRHAQELKLIKENAELELETWKTNYKKQKSQEFERKELEIKEKYRRERDEEIESVIEKLEHESNEMKKQTEEMTEHKIRRIKEKYENEIQEIEESEKETKQKYLEIRKKLHSTEDLLASLKDNLEQRDNQLEETKRLNTVLQKEREDLKVVIRGELKKEIEDLEQEVELMKTSRDREIQQLYSRIRISVAKKDEMLEEMTRDYQAVKEKCLYLENMLEQQRKEYLIKS